jgi:Flp pilus assembly pilin Flp
LLPGLAFPAPRPAKSGEKKMHDMLMLFKNVWSDDAGQDVAEYAVMLAVILVIVVGTIKIIGGKSNNVFSEVASSIQ